MRRVAAECAVRGAVGQKAKRRRVEDAIAAGELLAVEEGDGRVYSIAMISKEQN